MSTVDSRHHRKAEFWLYRIEQCRIFLEKGKCYLCVESDCLVKVSDKAIIKDLKNNLRYYMRQWNKYKASVAWYGDVLQC